MPPRKVYGSCKGRSTVPFQTFIRDPSSMSILAEAVSRITKGNFEMFAGQRISECVLSYPNSDWYSVYVFDTNGNSTWKQGEKVYEKLFFKLKLYPDGKYGPTSVTPDEPLELMGVEPCQDVNGSCQNPGGVDDLIEYELEAPSLIDKGKAPARAKKEVPPAQPPKEVPRDVLEKLSKITLNQAENKDSKVTASREYFEKLTSTVQMVDWMIQNMKTEDLVQCIKRGNLSAEEVRKAEAVRDSEPRGAGYQPDYSSLSVPTQAYTDADVAEIAGSMPEKQTYKMLLDIATEELIKDFNRENPGNDPVSRREAIIRFCSVRQPLQVKNTRQGPKLFTMKGRLISKDEDALKECAKLEAIRMKTALKTIRGGISPMLSRARQRIDLRKLASIPSSGAPSGSGLPTVDQVMALSKDQRIQTIKDLATQTGEFDVKKNVIVDKSDPDTEYPINDEETVEMLLNILKSKVRSRATSRASTVAGPSEIEPEEEFSDAEQELDEFAGKSKEQIVNYIKDLPKEQKSEAIIHLAEKVGGYTVSADRKTLTDEFENEMDIDMDTARTLAEFHEDTFGVSFGRRRSRFGRRKGSKKTKKVSKKGKKKVSKKGKKKVSKKQSAHRKRFSLAVKKCKGKANYQKCMKKNLSKSKSKFGIKRKPIKRRKTVKRSKTYTKTGRLRKKFLVSRGRMSPAVSATSQPIGKKMRGNDSKMWVIKKTKNGVKRWARI